MDVHIKNVRSFNMSRIKNKNTKPEILIRKICHKLGLRFRINQKLNLYIPDLHRVNIFNIKRIDIFFICFGSFYVNNS